MWKILCCVFAFGLINVISGASIPDYINVCHRSDPKLNECIKNSVETLRPRLKEGIPELDIPSLEPMHVNDIFISRGYGNYHFILNLTQVYVYGASDFQLNKLKLDVPNMTYKLLVSFPKLRLRGKYSVNTRLLSLPIVSDGDFDANATNCDATGILKGTIVNDKEYDHMTFTNLDINLKIGDYVLQLDNVVKGDPNLNEAINELVNTNKEDLIKLSTPFIESRASEILLTLANKVVRNFEYDKVFPE